jgi:hypothetical protein
MSTDHPEDTNHGDSIAAWVSVIVIMIAVTGATFFYLINDDMGVLFSGIGVLVGVALGPILKALGYGVQK